MITLRPLSIWKRLKLKWLSLTQPKYEDHYKPIKGLEYGKTKISSNLIWYADFVDQEKLDKEKRERFLKSLAEK